MNKFDVLMTNLQILSDLQNRVTDLLSCDEIQILEELSKFFVFLKDISISTNFGVYEGFLRLLVHLSIYYKIPKSDQEIQHMYNVFFAILKELISNHSLKTSFKISTLCFIFKYSNHFLLFLLEEGIFDFGFLQKILLKNKIPFLYFLPEIKKANPAGYIKYKKYHRLDNKFINYFYDFDIISILESMNEEQIQEEQNRNIFSDIRKETHSIEMLAKIIREDNLDSFQEFMQTHPDINLNSNIDPSIFEENPDLNNRWRGISLIEYSMAFGAINIFRYLWLNKVHFIEFSLKYSIMGGNYEIIHILEEECKYKFKKTSYSIAIQYYQNEISEYLFNYLEMTQLTFSKVLQLFNDSLNFDILFKWLCSMNSNTQENYQKTRITHYLLKYSQNAFFIFYDVLLHSNININALNTISFHIHNYFI
ncbi:hypothetical protein TRFO_13738 [Tritrichomonas foetus]|uniref:DUF3447 domain-containing protein n=1 Tax=Tritrichomonas foetus TaxID=1144522 RepID=A0A1J4KXI6_9EUKA|nr:hypothetical protein TRFO_13738 [Tritrichomonas foetus]|eukprot:OHT15890.1 hypothetical protein TRFO_13738 [Tritrichomonas foetus]